MMPFSFLKTSKGDGPRADSRNDSGVKLDIDSSEKEQRRQSKRHYFRNLLKLSSLSSDSKANKRRSGQFMSPQPLASPKSPSPPISPMNKPLPPPPPAAIEADPLHKAPVKLARIISPIALPDLHRIFSGAPQFFARSEGHNTGAPHPSVAFPWDEELHIRDLTDHWKIHDEAWGCVTAWPHITVQTSRNPDATKEHHEKQRAHFTPRCRERPNMLSMQGMERGTIGYQAALEMTVADALEIPGEYTDASPETISQHRKQFLNGKEGLRPVTDTTLVDRLLDVSEVYHEDPMKHQRPSVQLYSELFTQILFPPSRVTDQNDPYSLKIQIESIVQVLAAPLVWVDFSLVEWRIRLGQILWGASPDYDAEDGISVNNEALPETGTQRYWLLLQILLSCQLLIRLDAITMSIGHGLNLPKAEEIERFEKSATPSVKWSMILARAWLENIRLERSEAESAAEKKPAGWLATLTGTGTTEAVADGLGGLRELRFHGRHQSRQLSGLLHFARNIHWPDMDHLTAKAASNGISISDSIQSTPAGTPMTVASQRSSSYFSHRRPTVKRGLSLHKHVSTIIHPAGWLSNSYLSGLVLPGEGLSHFLMSTLLENDAEAVARLGEQACLYGGFMYRESSFWSTACIVGRVLAARKGASDCMGWIYSDVVPRGVKEGWIDIDIEAAELIDQKKKSSKPRLYRKQTVEHDGHVIGGADTSTVLPGDFILPSDESSEEALSVTFESLDLFAADSASGTPTGGTPTPLTELSLEPTIKSYSAMMRFTIESTGEDKRELNIALNHDIQFVTAHPCISSPHLDILKSASGPSISSPNSPSYSSTSATQGALSGHPLHKGFTYTKTPISKILSTPLSTPFTALLSPSDPSPQSSSHTTSSNIPKVLIIDCTDASMLLFPPRPAPSPGGVYGSTRVGKKHEFGSDLEMLARALCAERGWDALVSRRGRGCLACAVREAGALGWRVVIRVA